MPVADIEPQAGHCRQSLLSKSYPAARHKQKYCRAPELLAQSAAPLHFWMPQAGKAQLAASWVVRGCAASRCMLHVDALQCVCVLVTCQLVSAGINRLAASAY
jgi:hypothetical protein